MSEWPATKARRVLAALQRLARHRFAHHDKEEPGPVILSEIARHAGFRPENPRTPAR